MARVTLHRDAAGPGVLSVLKALASVLPHDRYYLAGGTALALLEGHRVSIDVDVFTPQLDDPQQLLHDLEAEVSGISDAVLGTGAVYLEIADVHVSLIAYRYPLIKAELVTDPDLLPLAHRDDIAAMKLAAITARGTRKDFIDMWTLVSRHESLEYYLRCFEAKFRHRDLGHVLRSLTYFNDAEGDPSLRLLTPLDWDAVKADLTSWVKMLLPRPT